MWYIKRLKKICPLKINALQFGTLYKPFVTNRMSTFRFQADFIKKKLNVMVICKKTRVMVILT